MSQCAGQAAGHSWVLPWGGCVWATKHVSGWAPPAAGGPICSLERPSLQPINSPAPPPHYSSLQSASIDSTLISGEDAAGRPGWGRRGAEQQHSSGIGGENTAVLCKHRSPTAPNVNRQKHEALQEFVFSLIPDLSEPVLDQLVPPFPAIFKAIYSDQPPSPRHTHMHAHAHTPSLSVFSLRTDN